MRTAVDSTRIRPTRLPFLTVPLPRAAVVLGLALACWPVARWYVARLTDGTDEPWGLVALSAALWCAPRQGWFEAIARTRLAAVCALLLTYATTYTVTPPLVHALLFVVATAVAVWRRDFPLAWGSLLVLSLPVIATLQFYAGYPLRVATTTLCPPLLRLGGLHVTADATTLRWAGETVVVDAPCSGIHMLWTGLFLAATLACSQRLDARATLRLLQRASLAVFVANVLRATALFCTETRIWPSPPWAHEGIGLVLFGVAAALIIATDTGIRPKALPAGPVPPRRLSEGSTVC